MLNSDNFDPPTAITALQEADGADLCGFSQEAMLRDGSVPADRLLKCAAIERSDGTLRRIVEKPTAEQMATLADTGGVWLSMNCWRFSPSIFTTCANIEPSSRSEYELPNVVQRLVDAGAPFAVKQCDAAALDLSSRADVAGVKSRLVDRVVRL